MTAAIALIAALSFVGGACLTYYVVARPHDQADALAALRRIHEQAIYGPDTIDAWGSSHDELASLVDVIDAEVAAVEMYGDDYIEAAT